MELELTRIDLEADIYDVRKAVEEVLHGPDLFDINHPDNKGRKPNFEVVMGESPAGRVHNGRAALRLPVKLGQKFFRWYRESEEHRIVVNRRPLKLFKTDNIVPPDVKQVLEKALYIDPDQDSLHKQIEERARQVRLRIAMAQFGVWYKPSDSPGSKRSFSVEYERDFVRHGAGYLHVEYQHKLIRIEIGQRDTEETKYLILVKFSSIRKLGIGWDESKDESKQPFIIFDLYTPPNFEQENYNNLPSGGIERKGKYKTRDRISAIDDGHANIAEYAHHLRIVLVEQDDLLQFEKICHIMECEPPPVRISGVDAQAMQFFSRIDLLHVQRWIKTMDWKDGFQIEAYLRCGLLNTRDLLVTLQKPIEEAIKHYRNDSSLLLRSFFDTLKRRKPGEPLIDCLREARKDYDKSKERAKKFKGPTDGFKELTDESEEPPDESVESTGLEGNFLCHHVIITPSRILLEGPYTTQSNRVIRRYQGQGPALAERFVRVEFRDEDRLSYRWDGDVDGTSFLHERVGRILRYGFEIAGRSFEFLGYSTSALRQHSVWFVSPFRDANGDYVTAEFIRSSVGDFTKLLQQPSKLAARIAQAFTATDRSVKIRRDQWEEQDDLGPEKGEFTDGVGTISSTLAEMIWEAKSRASRNFKENRVPPSAYQFRFLGYKGVVVVDSRLEGIKMRLRKSQCKFPVKDIKEEEEFEIARAFDYPNPVHLNRPAVMALENRGVDRQTFIDLQEKAKAEIYHSKDSLEKFRTLLRSHGLGGKYRLGFILEKLTELGLDFKDGNNKRAIKSAFFERLLRFSIHHSLREVKFKARIPVPKSYQLVGVADEGIAYIKEGVDEDDVYTLKPGTIYVCVQENLDEKPIYLKGNCVISRSPVIHPGDVQRVYAVGEPPEGKVCFFRGLKNVVVLPAVGDRALASCLAGGDLDGDTYDIYYANPGLLPPIHADPAEYPPGKTRTLDRDATVGDICDFIVEYIHSDVMGLLADRHIVIADQSKDGVFDSRCMKLAGLCSQAVDYPKNGNPVEIDGNIPKPLIRFKPDWHKAEVTGTRDVDYYISDRALGYMFRSIEQRDPIKPIEGLATECYAPLKDPITKAVARCVRDTLNLSRDKAAAIEESSADNRQAEQLHAHYAREMRYICITHTLVDTPDVRLKEEEVVLGTILAFCVQTRWRSDRSYRMKLHAEELVEDIHAQLVQCKEVGSKTATEEQQQQLRAGLPDAWSVWCWAQHHKDDKEREYMESFSLLILRIVLDCLKHLGGLPESKNCNDN